MGLSQSVIAGISLLLIVFCIVVLVVGIYVLHSLPGRIAEGRNHPQAEAITVCSVLGLLVFPLWMAALVWAYAGTVGAPLPPEPEPLAPSGPAAEPVAALDESSPSGSGA